MTGMQLLVLGLVIGSNNLAAALALGALGQSSKKWRIISTFGLFEFVIPLIGLWIGQQLSHVVSTYAEPLAITILAGLGFWILISALRSTSVDQHLADRLTSWRGLFLLAAGLSFDNLIVGFGLGLREAEPLKLASCIAAFSVVFTWLGLKLGREARRNWETIAQIGAGSLLIGIAILSWLGLF